ncbi:MULTISPECIES: hypothetical protein [Tepidanaerobacter]|uniref:hypothetical protein n=1 Tax=Tepidanaerobacter TaxID=499228 RepID=UPI001BD23220|nr:MULTISPECIES: hypothetical protein [Tepidanaerobacter]
MQQMFVYEPTNIFILVDSDKNRSAEDVIKALDTVIGAMKGLNLTIGEVYTFIDILLTDLYENKI